MRDDLVFSKTRTGEDAVQERTRLVQRNLRMVLILVDGVVSVSGLKQEVGDPAMVESALAELERMGLIESPEAHEALDASEIETLPAYPSKAVSASEIETIPPIILAPAESVVVEPTLVARAAKPASGMQASPEMPLVQADTVFDEETAMLMRFAPKYEQPATEKPAKRSPLSDISGWWETARKERAQAKEEALYEQAYGKDDSTGEAAVRPEKGPGLTIEFRWSWLFFGIFGLFAVALLVVILFPYDNYRPEFEKRMSRVLQDDVKIGEVRLSFLPYPAITLDRVAVGADPYVSMNEVRLVPELGSLLGPRYREVSVTGVRVKEAGLANLSKWFLPAGMEDAAVGRLEITGLAVDLAGTSIEGLHGSARIDDHHGLNKLVLRGPEGDLRIEVTPGLAGVGLNFSAMEWKTPFQPQLQFSFLEMRGELVPGRLTINSVDGRLYDGGLTGEGALTWTQEPTLTLSLNMQRVSAERLLAVLGTEPVAEGGISGKVQVSSRGGAVGRLDRDLRYEGTFSIERGNLKRFDFVSAVRPGDGSMVRGGTTNFQELSGAFSVDSRTVRFTGLRMASGLMRVAGQASIARPDGALSGSAGVEMRGSASATRSSITLSGSLREPKVRSNRSTGGGDGA